MLVLRRVCIPGKEHALRAELCQDGQDRAHCRRARDADGVDAREARGDVSLEWPLGDAHFGTLILASPPEGRVDVHARGCAVARLRREPDVLWAVNGGGVSIGSVAASGRVCPDFHRDDGPVGVPHRDQHAPATGDLSGVEAGHSVGDAPPDDAAKGADHLAVDLRVPRRRQRPVARLLDVLAGEPSAGEVVVMLRREIQDAQELSVHLVPHLDVRDRSLWHG